MSRIPRQFHFVFGLKKQTQPFPLAYYLALESCRQVNQPERILFHYRHEPFGNLWDRIKPHLEMRRVDAGPRWLRNTRYKEKWIYQYRYAHEADYIRLDALMREGGAYADIDSLFLRPLPAEMWEEGFVIGAEGELWSEEFGRNMPSYCNAFLMSAPGSAFSRRWHEGMRGAFDGTWSHHSCATPARLAAAHPKELRIEPPQSFYPYMWTPEKVQELLESSNAPAVEGAYSLHLWNHLWWSRSQKNWSKVHGGMVDRDYVAAGRTPYAQLAKPFLPPTNECPPDRGWRAWLGRHWPQ